MMKYIIGLSLAILYGVFINWVFPFGIDVLSQGGFLLYSPLALILYMTFHEPKDDGSVKLSQVEIAENDIFYKKLKHMTAEDIAILYLSSNTIKCNTIKSYFASEIGNSAGQSKRQNFDFAIDALKREKTNQINKIASQQIIPITESNIDPNVVCLENIYKVAMKYLPKEVMELEIRSKDILVRYLLSDLRHFKIYEIKELDKIISSTQKEVYKNSKEKFDDLLSYYGSQPNNSYHEKYTKLKIEGTTFSVIDWIEDALKVTYGKEAVIYLENER